MIERGREFHSHAVGILAAHVVTFEQNLGTTADAHQVMAQILEARIFVADAHEREQRSHDQQQLCNPLQHWFRWRPHQSPAPTAGAVCTRAGTRAAIGAAFGTRAVTVPKIMMISPVQIHGTIGFR